MKTIIVPTDFSPVSINAVNFAAKMAGEINANLMLFHAYHVPISMNEVPSVIITAEELRKDSEKKLAELKSSVEQVTTGKIKLYTETRAGNVVDEIEELCEKIQPFSVVIGATGTSGLERVLFGSNTLKAIRQLTWPVIVVPAGKEFGKGIKRIGFACDFKKVIETTPIKFISQVIQEFKAEIHVLNVDYKNRNFSPETPEQSIYLHTMLEPLNPDYHFINHEDIEDGINEFAEANNIDMLIVIPKKHTVLEGLFKPSSTKQLVAQSQIPVMCIHE